MGSGKVAGEPIDPLAHLLSREVTLEIVDTRNSTAPETRKGRDIPINTVFYGQVDDERRLYLRAYDVVIDLDDPHRTYSFNYSAGDPGPSFDNYRAVVARIVVE